MVAGCLGNDVIVTGAGNDLVAGDNLSFFGNPDAPGGKDLIVTGAGDDEVLSAPVTTPCPPVAETTSWPWPRATAAPALTA
jgi:hypothetical protein